MVQPELPRHTTLWEAEAVAEVTIQLEGVRAVHPAPVQAEQMPPVPETVVEEKSESYMLILK